MLIPAKRWLHGGESNSQVKVLIEKQKQNTARAIEALFSVSLPTARGWRGSLQGSRAMAG